jgi:hypothetical protein
VGFDVLGAVIQRATKQPLDEFLKVRLCFGLALFLCVLFASVFFLFALIVLVGISVYSSH